MNNEKFKGIHTALITPFSQGRVDLPRFRDFVEWQINQGIHGLVPCGTTGESPTLSVEEHKSVVETCIEVAAGRVPVTAGVGSNNTAKSVELAKHAKDAGADAALIVAPYYNKPTQAGMLKHFEAVSEAASLPSFVYNIPGRSIVDVAHDTMQELAKMPYIAGVKDATADLSRPTAVRLDCGADFIQLSGEDASTAGFLAQGGHGAISVTSNVAPFSCSRLYEAWTSGDLQEFARIRDLLNPIHEAMFMESSPAPIKRALSQLGFCDDELRLPLISASKETQDCLKTVLANAQLPEHAQEEKQVSHG